MDAKIVNPFIDAVLSILPQLGFQNITRGSMAVRDQFVVSKGAVVVVGLAEQISGNVVYNMPEETVKSIASVMMMGMPVTAIDPLVESAISELANMITGNAAINMEKSGYQVDISPPSLVLGENVKVKVCSSKYLVLELSVDSNLLELNIGVE